MKQNINLILSFIFLIFLLSCEKSKTNSEVLSNEMAERTKILTEGSYLDDNLLRGDGYTSGILENPENFTIEDIYNNYQKVIQVNKGNIGLENYKRFYLNSLMDIYELDKYEDNIVRKYFLDEHYTLENFKNPFAEFALLESLRRDLPNNSYLNYLNKTKLRCKTGLDSFKQLLEDEEFANNENKAQKVKDAIKMYEELLLKIENTMI